MHYLLLFLEGIITFISPCMLPMLPLYVSYFSAGESDRRRTFTNALGFVSGFAAVFVALGAFAGAVGRLLIAYGTAINIITGAVVIVLGLNFAGVLNIGFLNRNVSRTANVANLKFMSSIIFGFIFAIGWTPCVGAFLGSALMMAARRGGMLNGVLMLSVYALGLGAPFLVGALLIDRLKEAFEFIKRNYKIINKVSGALLVLMGLFMATGYMGRLLSLLSI
ncbi:MAG: cytochrome c biogenesis protein CcdA [Oscillospiraceae bacterium]|nr:cytochrome c biogenesis protein CcdA [Oscillospiraceae bacterium]